MGKATKLVELIMDQPKVYRVTARLDVTSESFDSDSPLIPVDAADPPTPQALQEAFQSLEGRINQVPPIISAIKIGGRPAYKRARDGSLSEPRPLGSVQHSEPPVRQSPLTPEPRPSGSVQHSEPPVRPSPLGSEPRPSGSVQNAEPRPSGSGPDRDRPFELKPRQVDIYWLHVHSYAWPHLDFEMCCGRGTYVRALIRDVGHALGTGGCLTSLIRTRVGPFTVVNAWTFDSLGESPTTATYLLDLPRAGELLDPNNRTIPPRPT